VAVVVLGMLTSAPVLAALDLTGTWQGKWKCKAVTGGAATKPQGAVTMMVTQSGGDVNALLDWEGFGSGAFQGHVQERIDKPGQGATTLLACSTRAGSSNYAEALSANVKVSSSTATLKGVSTYEELPVPTVGGTCKYSLKRTALADPGVAACPATCPTSSCGDGVTDLPTEECDDGNQVTEECAYGQAPCVVCDATCQNVEATGPSCGDGVVDATYETCDDGNAAACGSCSANCKVVQQAQATGLIVPVPLSELSDGDSFTIADGIGTTAVFEFDSNFNVSPGAMAIALDGNATRSHAAGNIAAAIEAHATLRVDAVANGPVVLLIHQVNTSLGNQAIVTSAGISTDFYVTGMSGGMGGDCGPGVHCASNADCASGQCGTNVPGTCD
jgi:cysteine-rich repeat protein